MVCIKNKYLLVFLCIIFFSCKKDIVNNIDTTVKIEEQTKLDVVYANVSSQQKMDVYLPANRSETKTFPFIMIHGGSWSGGDKTDFNSYISAFKIDFDSSYAIFNLNYRLANGSTILLAQQLSDIDAAINFIISKSSEYKINTTKIGIMGASAGAHLALMKAYKANTNNTIKAVVNLFGPTDLTWMYNNHPYPFSSQPILVNLLNTTPQANATTYSNASPINFVTSTSPPTIIFHGTNDIVVPISESNNLQTKLQQNGVINQYVTYTGESHGWVGNNLLDTYSKTVSFIKQYLK